jgi:hypothetical protein
MEITKKTRMKLQKHPYKQTQQSLKGLFKSFYHVKKIEK